MIRRPRRTVPATVVALVLLAAAVLVAVSGVQVLLGRPPVVPFDDLAALGAQVTLADPAVVAAAAGTALVGLLLLALALRPGSPTVLPLSDGGSGIDTGITRRSLDRALADAAGQVDGVRSATVRSRRTRVRADVRPAFGDPAQLRSRVREQLAERLAGIGPASTPRITVRVVRPRRT